MTEFLSHSSFFAILLTLSAFEIARVLQRRLKLRVLNPIAIGAILVGAVLLATGISVVDYQRSCASLKFLLTPATSCISISLYEQTGKLKKHLPIIFISVVSGSVASLLSIRFTAALFQLNETLTISLLPKNITTAIGMALSQEAGGIPALTTAVIVLTGVLGNMLGPVLCKLFRLTHPIAQGVALGTSAHAVGTSRASEMSALAGAASSMSLTVAGLVTAILFSFFV